MEGRRKEKTQAALIGAVGIAALAVTVYKVMLCGPLRPVLQNERTHLMMAETALVFLWSLFCLWGNGRKKLRLTGLAGGILLFTWCHRIFLPIVVSGIYMAALVLTGKQILRLFLKGIRLPVAEQITMSLVLGSAAWMTIVCLVSLTGHGGLTLWRGLAAAMAMAAAVMEAVQSRIKWPVWRDERRDGWRDERRPDWLGAWQHDRRDAWRPGWLDAWPRNRFCICLLAFIITMVLVQAGRMNIELDYDSLHYGLRSAYVLDNGKGIYENLGMINLVYTYSKGLEVLVLPLSGTSTYGFVLAFSLWCTLGILLLAAHMVGRYCGKGKGLWTAAILAAIPGIMNMAATSKSDNITLLHQLIIYDFICLALWGRERQSTDPSGDGGDAARFGYAENCPWLLMAVSTYLLTLVYKPTALVFSTALGGVAVLSLILSRRFTFGDRKGWQLLLIPAAAAAGLWYRTWLMTGVPVTSIFAGFFERAGCRVKYPFTFTHVIGDPSALTAGEKAGRLGKRLWGMLFAPVTEDMAHVIIAWGTGLVTVFLVIWVISACKAGADQGKTVKGGPYQGEAALNLFDRILIPVMALGSIASIYTLYQVDGNYFILFYALLIISALRMGNSLDTGHLLKRTIALTAVSFFIVNTAVTCTTGWAGVPGFTPVKMRHRGYYDHRRDAAEKRIQKGYQALSCMFTPESRVLAFGNHPEILDLPCSVQSYYDVTGSGGNVYLVKRLAYFEEFLQYAQTEYFFVEAGYLAGQDRALQIIEDMIVEGSLSDLRYEWGNMTARVTLGAEPPDDPEQALDEFRANYSMTENK